MLKAAPILLALFASGATAQVYRWVDAEGQTHFSDRPVTGSEAVTIGAEAGSKALLPGDGPPTPALGPYRSFEIVYPEANQTFRQESVSVPMSLLIDPSLMVGHRIEVVVDGVPISLAEPIGAQLALTGLGFGTHVVEARVMHADGIVARSDLVSFHVRKPLPPGVLP